MAEKPDDKIAALDFDAAINRLFENQWLPVNFDALPPGWPAWKVPASALDIDDEVKTLIERRNSNTAKIKMRERKELQPIFFCPYFYVRYAIANSANLARVSVENTARAGAAIAKLNRLQETASDIATQIGAMLNSYSSLNFNNEYTVDGSSFDVDMHMARMFEARKYFAALNNVALESLMGIARAAKNEAERLNPIRGVVWKQVFAEQMGYAWYALTGSNPSPASNSLFQNFVESAYRSLSGGQDSNFERAIQTVTDRIKHNRAQNDGFDREMLVNDEIVEYRNGVRMVEQPLTQEQKNAEVTMIVQRARRGTPQAVWQLQEILKLNPEEYEPLARPFASELEWMSAWTYQWTIPEK